MLNHDKPLSFWMERRRNSQRILKERQAEVSIMEADVRECDRNIRRLSGYDKIGKDTEKRHNLTRKQRIVRMDKPIDLTSKIIEREEMKRLSELKYYTHENNETWFSYQYEFEFLDKKYGLEIWARSWDEAEAVGQAVKKTLKLKGITCV